MDKYITPDNKEWIELITSSLAKERKKYADEVRGELKILYHYKKKLEDILENDMNWKRKKYYITTLDNREREVLNVKKELRSVIYMIYNTKKRLNSLEQDPMLHLEEGVKFLYEFLEYFTEIDLEFTFTPTNKLAEKIMNTDPELLADFEWDKETILLPKEVIGERKKIYKKYIPERLNMPKSKGGITNG